MLTNYQPVYLSLVSSTLSLNIQKSVEIIDIEFFTKPLLQFTNYYNCYCSWTFQYFLPFPVTIHEISATFIRLAEYNLKIRDETFKTFNQIPTNDFHSNLFWPNYEHYGNCFLSLLIRSQAISFQNFIGLFDDENGNSHKVVFNFLFAWPFAFYEYLCITNF